MDYFVPSLLNDLMGEAEQDARAVVDRIGETPPGGILDTIGLVADTAKDRQGLELERKSRFGLMFETLTDKYRNALRTEALFREVAAGSRTFVLFLRGFSMKQIFRPEITERFEADFGEYGARFELARSIAPTPLVTVRNPATSESLIGVFDGAEGAADTTYAVDLDNDWESDVEALVGAASYIVVRNAHPGPGLDSELAMLRRLGRLNDTFFSNPDSPQINLGGAVARPLDDRATAEMLVAQPRPMPAWVRLPSPPTCLWIQRERRRRVAENVFATFDFLNRLADRGQPMPRDMQERLLYSTVALSIGLERLDLLVPALGSYTQVLGMYRPDELPDPGSLLSDYQTVTQAVARAVESAGVGDVLDAKDFGRLRNLLSMEDPDELVRATMRVIDTLHLRLGLA